MKNKIFLILMVGLMILFSGCDGGSSSSSTTSSVGGQTFKGGSDALSLSFDKGMPPEKVLDNGRRTFSIRMKIKNEGEYTIPKDEANIIITGIDPKTFNFVGENKNYKSLPEIAGYKKRGSSEIKGREIMTQFSGLKYIPDIFSGSITVPFFTELCYPYQTKVSTSVCVKEKTEYEENKQISKCELEENKKTSNSGAPVSVQNLKQTIDGDHSIRIEFDIVHKPTTARSFLFKRDSLTEQCRSLNTKGDPVQDLDIIDKVSYTIDTKINDKPFICSDENSNSATVQLSDNKYTVSCTLDTQGITYEANKPVLITLTYDYFQNIEKDFIVEHYN